MALSDAQKPHSSNSEPTEIDVKFKKIFQFFHKKPLLRFNAHDVSKDCGYSRKKDVNSILYFLSHNNYLEFIEDDREWKLGEEFHDADDMKCKKRQDELKKMYKKKYENNSESGKRSQKEKTVNTFYINLKDVSNVSIGSNNKIVNSDIEKPPVQISDENLNDLCEKFKNF